MRSAFIGAITIMALLSPWYVFAQETSTVTKLSGFTLKKDHFFDANVPMSSLEQKLFLDVAKTMDRLVNKFPDTIPYVSGSSLLSVKVSSNNAILINMNKRLLSKDGGWSAEVEDYLSILSNEVTSLARKKFKRVTGVFYAIEGRNFESFMHLQDKALTPQGAIPSA